MLFGKMPCQVPGKVRQTKAMSTSGLSGDFAESVEQMATYLSVFPSTEAAGSGQPQTTGVSKVSHVWLRYMYEY